MVVRGSGGSGVSSINSHCYFLPTIYGNSIIIHRIVLKQKI
nr:MAG TPA: hypothetical protein [Caudoviricetes sp.]